MSGKEPNHGADLWAMFQSRNRFSDGFTLGCFWLVGWFFSVFLAAPVFSPMTEADYLVVVLSGIAGPVLGLWLVGRMLVKRHFRTLLGWWFGVAFGVLLLVFS